MQTKVVYEDRDVIVVHKPAGLATQTAAVGQADVVSELKNHLKSSYLGVVHRLDQPVEGLLVFGKTKDATAALSGQLAKGILNKRYYCVVCGRPAATEGKLSDHLYKDAQNCAKIVPEALAKEKQAKLAVLRYKIWESVSVTEILPEGFNEAEDVHSCGDSAAEVLALAEISLETGRFHQIRAQMAHAGLPLLGDRKYGNALSEAFGRKLQVKNVALCASSLQFYHPRRKEKMDFAISPQAPIFQIFSKINQEDKNT